MPSCSGPRSLSRQSRPRRRASAVQAASENDGTHRANDHIADTVEREASRQPILNRHSRAVFAGVQVEEL